MQNFHLALLQQAYSNLGYSEQRKECKVQANVRSIVVIAKLQFIFSPHAASQRKFGHNYSLIQIYRMMSQNSGSCGENGMLKNNFRDILIQWFATTLWCIWKERNNRIFRCEALSQFAMVKKDFIDLKSVV